MIAATFLALAATATGATSWEAVLVSPDGTVERSAIEIPLEDAGLGDADRAWVWREDMPPSRLTREELTLVVAAPEAVDSVRFVIRAKEKPLPEGLRLVAAPAAMWEEVPERLLPSFAPAGDGSIEIPCMKGSLWRARAHGGGFSSVWADVSGCRTTHLQLAPASSRSVRITPGMGGRLRVLEGPDRFDPPGLIALFDDAGRGVVTIPDAPRLQAPVVVAEARGGVPRAWRTPLDALPQEIRLDQGAELSGRTMLADGEPAPGAIVRAEWWIEGIHALPGSAATRSDENGIWTLGPVPRHDVMLVAELDGHAAAKLRLSPQDDAVDAGDLVLSAVTTLRIEVVTREREPVKGAVVFASGRDELTDDEGIAVVSAVAADRPLRITVGASGFLRESFDIPFPLPERHRVTLTRSFRVKGRFVAAGGEAPPGILLKLRQATRESLQRVEPDGSFDLDLPPDTVMELVFLSPVTRELPVPLLPGRPGETRDLGEVIAVAGAVVSGRILDARDYTPLSRARVWSLRPSSSPNVAFARNEIVEALSDAEGVFELSGLDSLPTLLRVEAPGFARQYREIVPEPPPASNELPDIAIGPGATLRVETEDGDRARADLRGDGSEADMITAAIVDGAATLTDVPPGEARIEVLSGRNLLCETSIDVPHTTDEIVVPCTTRKPLVRGDVTVGNRRGTGMLTWRRAVASADVAIVSRHSGSGLAQFQLFGTPKGDLTLLLRDGRFETRALTPGRWRVEWLPDEGGSSVSREVVIDDREEQYVALRYAGGRIEGIVVDPEAKPVARAFVAVGGSAEGVVSRTDGTFSIIGVPAGTVRLQAREGHRVSDGVSVEVRDGRAAGPIRLTLGRDARGEVRVTVRGADRAPARFAMVFVQFGSYVAIATADASGVASVHVPTTNQVRAAANVNGQWTFGDWSHEESLSLEIGKTGTLTIVSDGDPEGVRVTSPGGWDLTALFERLGVEARVGPGRPLVLGGLPPGTWLVEAGSRSQRATVEPGKAVTVTLR